MKTFVNIRERDQRETFSDAVQLGLGRGQGLFFLERIEPLPGVAELLDTPFVERSAIVLHHLLRDELPLDTVRRMVTRAFDFPLELSPATANTHALELFHGPSLAFKDFGARFMAQCLGNGAN